MVQTSDVEWTNGVGDTKLGPRVPALIRGFSLTPAGTHRGRTATNMIKAALGRGAQIDDVLVDPGYSLAKVETFLLPVRREGLHVTFRPASYQWDPKPFNDDAITIGGQLFYAGVPEKMRKLTMPPMGSSVEESGSMKSRTTNAPATATVCTLGPTPMARRGGRTPSQPGHFAPNSCRGRCATCAAARLSSSGTARLRPAP